jgi:hypothetical protein
VASITLTSTITGCRQAAIYLAPEKAAEESDTDLARRAKEGFWSNFFEARYEELPQILFLLTAAYLENPRDPKISLLLAHAHFWKLAERSREPELKPGITDHAILAERYFEEAYRLAPNDHRIPGWLGGLKLALGNIHKDERLTRTGYFMLQDAKDFYPEFNHFSASYAMSGVAPTHDRFPEVVEDIWANSDLCAGERIDRRNADYSRYMSRETTEGSMRVCWNGALAPHNFEGFVLHMGDVLVKNGQPDVAKSVYRGAKLSKGYETWRYRSVLEERIAKADERARLFQSKDPKQHPEIMLNSSYACTACHAR